MAKEVKDKKYGDKDLTAFTLVHVPVAISLVGPEKTVDLIGETNTILYGKYGPQRVKKGIIMDTCQLLGSGKITAKDALMLFKGLPPDEQLGVLRDYIGDADRMQLFLSAYFGVPSLDDVLGNEVALQGLTGDINNSDIFGGTSLETGSSLYTGIMDLPTPLARAVIGGLSPSKLADLHAYILKRVVPSEPAPNPAIAEGMKEEREKIVNRLREVDPDGRLFPGLLAPAATAENAEKSARKETE
jgi:hypothetical protein